MNAVETVHGTFNIINLQALFVDFRNWVIQSKQNPFNFDGSNGVDIIDVQALFVELSTS